MRTTLRHVYLSFFGQFSKPSCRTHFLNGHYIFAAPCSAKIQREAFKKLLTQLAAHSTLVEPQQAKEKLLQTEKSIIALTFDDGFADIREVISPVLEELNLAALFFVNPAYLGVSLPDSRAVIDKFYKPGLQKEFLSKQDIKDLHKRGHGIGSHGLTHIRLNNVSPQQAIEEIVKSQEMLEDIIGAPCRDFAYPFGGENDISTEALALALEQYDAVFSSTTGNTTLITDSKVINRRHFEGGWPSAHIHYFLAKRVLSSS